MAKPNPPHQVVDLDAYRRARPPSRGPNGSGTRDPRGGISASTKPPQNPPPSVSGRRKIDPTLIETLVTALRDGRRAAAQATLVRARNAGYSSEEILTNLLCETMRRLWDLFVEKKIVGAQMERACDHLYQLARGQRVVGKLRTQAEGPTSTSRILLALVPGDSHVFGMEIAAQLLLGKGFVVDCALSEQQDAILTRVREDGHDVIVLVAYGDTLMPDILSLALAVRIARPDVHLLVAGGITEQLPDVARLIGAEAAVANIPAIVDQITQLVGVDA